MTGPGDGGRLRRMEDGEADEDGGCSALASRDETAYGHARAIVDAAKYSLLGGSYWAMAKVPVEAEAMTAAIAMRMNVGSKMGQVDIPMSVIRTAVNDVLEGRPLGW